MLETAKLDKDMNAFISVRIQGEQAVEDYLRSA